MDCLDCEIVMPELPSSMNMASREKVIAPVSGFQAGENPTHAIRVTLISSFTM
jgi:hypothetical protein